MRFSAPLNLRVCKLVSSSRREFLTSILLRKATYSDQQRLTSAFAALLSFSLQRILFCSARMAAADTDQAEPKVASSESGELDEERSETLAPHDVNDIANRKALLASINSESQAPNKTTEETAETETNESTEEAQPRDSNPPLPQENPPLPKEDPPDDGWQALWDPSHQTYYFYHAATNTSQWENPRVPSATQYPSSGNPAPGEVCYFYWYWHLNQAHQW